MARSADRVLLRAQDMSTKGDLQAVRQALESRFASEYDLLSSRLAAAEEELKRTAKAELQAMRSALESRICSECDNLGTRLGGVEEELRKGLMTVKAQLRNTDCLVAKQLESQRRLEATHEALARDVEALDQRFEAEKKASSSSFMREAQQGKCVAAQLDRHDESIIGLQRVVGIKRGQADRPGSAVVNKAAAGDHAEDGSGTMVVEECLAALTDTLRGAGGKSGGEAALVLQSKEPLHGGRKALAERLVAVLAGGLRADIASSHDAILNDVASRCGSMAQAVRRVQQRVEDLSSESGEKLSLQSRELQQVVRQVRDLEVQAWPWRGGASERQWARERPELGTSPQELQGPLALALPPASPPPLRPQSRPTSASARRHHFANITYTA